MIRECADLPQRLSYPIKGSVFQELLLANAPIMAYSLSALLPALLLLHPSDEQFLFSLLPSEIRGNTGWMLAGVAVEFWFVQFLMSIGHFVVFHVVTFIRVSQTALARSTESIR